METNYWIMYLEVDLADVGSVQSLLEAEDNAGVMLQTHKGHRHTVIVYGLTGYNLNRILAMVGDLIVTGKIKSVVIKPYEEDWDGYRQTE